VTTARSIAFVAFLVSLLMSSGCASPGPEARQPTVPGAVARPAAQAPALPATIPGGYAPVRIGILPLTELSRGSREGTGATLKAYVRLTDSFNSSIKAPGVLRFELYQYVPRSAEPKGQRIAIWRDVDLTAPAENNAYWRDFLRAYEFTFDAQADPSRTYILQVTCLCLEDKRLTTEFTLKPGR
jgi:hypothetical protein